MFDSQHVSCNESKLCLVSCSHDRRCTSYNPAWTFVSSMGFDFISSAFCRLQYSLTKGHCSKDCEDSLQHMISSHIRSRYANGDVLPDEVKNFTYRGLEEHRATVFLQHRLASLFQDYMEKKGFQRD